MGGILHHTFAGLICALIVYGLFKKTNYSLSIFIGNFLPDLVGAGWAALLVGSVDPRIVLTSEPWYSAEKNIVMQLFWIFIQGTFIVIYLFIRKYRRRKEIGEFEDILALLLLGFIIHVLMDIYIIEQGVWY